MLFLKKKIIKDMLENLIYIFIGFFIGFVNDICLRWTVNIFLRKKNLWIINLSFCLRILAICLVFYLLISKTPRSTIFLAIGLIIDRIFMKLKNKGLVNANND